MLELDIRNDMRFITYYGPTVFSFMDFKVSGTYLPADGFDLWRS